MLKMPALSDVVAVFVPFTETVAPASGSLLSLEVIFPETEKLCEKAGLIPIRIRQVHSSAVFNFIYAIV
jgi:hypothetical protein